MKNFLLFTILTSVVVFAWIGLGIYHARTASTISEDTNIRIVPITPTFNLDVIDKLKRKEIIDANLSQSKVPPKTLEGNVPSSTPSISVTPSVSVTPSSEPTEITPSPTATVEL